MNKLMIKSAKEQLARHKTLGESSKLSIMQVAELFDIVAGQAEPSTINSHIIMDNGFSLN